MRKTPYRYQIGDIITDVKSGKLEILDQIRIPHYRKNKNDTHDKGYKYHCLICNNEDIIDESNLYKHHVGCNVCCSSPKKTLKGYNDMWTTNPELAKLLADPENGYKYTKNSEKRLDFKCPDCGNIIKNKMISQINNQGLSCPKCSDKLPYPEKIMYQVLKELKINFVYQYNPNWCKYTLNNKNKKGRYDFNFKLDNKEYIIETDGDWHNKDNNLSNQTKEESKTIDNFKENLAREHGIEIIRIDCQESNLDYIKNNKKGILNSRLNDIFDLSKIDWLQCHKFACSSLVKQACDYWNLNKYTTTEIGNMLKLDRSTIVKYLKQGNEINWCKYNAREEYKKSLDKMHIINTRKIICLNNKEIFNSITEISKIYKIDASSISACCKNKRKSTGKDPITKEKFKWMYYDDYLKLESK